MYQNVVCLIFAILVSLGAVGAFVLTGISAFQGSGRNTVRARGILGGGLTGLAVLLWLGWTGVLLQGRMRFGPWFYPAIGITVLTVAALAWAIVVSVQRRGAWRIVRGWLIAALGITATVFAWCGFAGVWHPERKGWLFHLGVIGVIVSVLLLARALYESIWAKRRRALSWILFAVAGIATLFLWLGHNGVFSAGPSDGPVEPTGSPEPTVSEPPEEYALEPICLNEEDYQMFLSRVTLDFSTNSLGGEWTQDRLAAVALYANSNDVEAFHDAVNYPVKEWFPEFDELMDSSLPIERRLELQKMFLDALDQEMVSNIPFGLMVLEGMRDIPFLYTNNADVIDGNIAVIDQFFDGTYKQPTDEESLKIELNKIPTLGSKYKGLDYLVVKGSGLATKPQVREEWARLMAWVSAGLRNYAFRETGAIVEARESSINWENSCALEVSLTRMVKADKQEDKDAVILNHIKKTDGNVASLIGFNRYDSRLEIYNPNQPEPEHTDPPVDTTDPPAQPSQPITTPPPTVKYFNVYTRWVDIDTGATLKDWFLSHSNVANGASYTVTAGQLTGFTAKKISIEGVGEWWLPSVSDTIHGHDARVTVFYDRNAYNLYYECGYYGMNGGWNVLQSKTYAGTYEYEQAYTVHAPNFLPSYKLISATPATGKMPAQDYTIYFVYSPVDGQGAKNPQDDPVYQSNAPIGGGPNLPTDGTGTAQPTEPPRQDYPPTASQNPVINTPPSAPPDQNGGYTDENRPINSAPPVVDNGLGGETSGGMVTVP